MKSASAIVSYLVLELEAENAPNPATNIMSRVLLYLTDRTQYEINRSKWGSTMTEDGRFWSGR
jgi:hypothetical protein